MNTQFIQSISIDWNKIEKDSYLRKIESIHSLNRLEFTKSVTFFVDENGSGKSTLLEAIANSYGFNPEGGTKNYLFSTYDSQFMIVIHSPILLGLPNAEIWNFDDGLLHLCEYEETDSYQITEMFINNRNLLLERLLTKD